ncbi:hypothetical protein CTM63_01605 [Prevotella intermedia]|nr:hypothetical protein CTM63_01605 [Prevotella intermedia]
MFVLFTPSILQYPYQRKHSAIMTHKCDKKSYFTIQDLLCKTVKNQCKQTHRFIFPNRKHLSIFFIAALVFFIL